MLLSKGKVLVTGGAGFIGSHQVDALIKSGYKVVVVDDLSTGIKDNLNPKAKFYEADIRDDELDRIFKKEKPKYVFHFAAQININHSVEDPLFDADVNIIGSLNVLENCIEHGVKKIMFSSTGGALYGEAEQIPTTEEYLCNPLLPYAIAKFTVENYLKFYKNHYGLDYGIIRIANAYGPRQNAKCEAGVITVFVETMLDKKQPFIYGDGHQTRDFIFVDDVVSANMMIFESSKSDIYNVGTGRQTTINEIFGFIRDSLGLNIKEKYNQELVGQDVSCLSSEKLKKALNWSPKVEVEEGIKQTVQWFQDKRERK